MDVYIYIYTFTYMYVHIIFALQNVTIFELADLGNVVDLATSFPAQKPKATFVLRVLKYGQYIYI